MSSFEVFLFLDVATLAMGLYWRSTLLVDYFGHGSEV